MENVNVISTPDITGDISICETKVVKIDCATRSNFFVCNDVSISTNNCTNETKQYDSWHLKEEGIAITIIGIPVTIFLIGLFIILLCGIYHDMKIKRNK